MNLCFQLVFSFRLSLSAAANHILSLCSRIPTASFRPLPAIRPWLSDCFRRPAYGFNFVTCDLTAANQPVCCDLTAPVGHFPASLSRLSTSLLRPDRACLHFSRDSTALFSLFPVVRLFLSARKPRPVYACFPQTRGPTARFHHRPAVLFLNPAPLLQYFLHLHSHLFHLQPYFPTSFFATSFLFPFTESV